MPRELAPLRGRVGVRAAQNIRAHGAADRTVHDGQNVRDAQVIQVRQRVIAAQKQPYNLQTSLVALWCETQPCMVVDVQFVRIWESAVSTVLRIRRCTTKHWRSIRLFER